MPYIRRRPSGNWQAIVKVNGRRTSVTGRTRAEAAQLAAARLLEMGATTTGGTVADLMAAWVATEGPRLSPTYRADAIRIIDRIPTTFATTDVADIRPTTLDHLYRTLLADGWTPHRVRRLHTVLSSAWATGRRWGWTTTNPYADVRQPTTGRRAVDPPTPAQVAALIDATDPTFATYIAVAATIGARRGEMVALQWADITTTPPTIIVRRARAYAPGAGTVTTAGKIGAAGHRVIAIDARLAERLEDIRRTQQAHQPPSGPQAPIWTFSHDHGATPWRPDYVTRRFRQLRRQVGIPDHIRGHDLRHYVATQLLAAGVPLKVVGDRLGHSQLSTTSDTYAHHVPAADRAAADVMASLQGSP